MSVWRQVLVRRLRLAGGFDFERVARLTPGFVGADLAALTKEAAACAVARIFSSLERSPAAPPSFQAHVPQDEHAADPPAAVLAQEGASADGLAVRPCADGAAGRPAPAAEVKRTLGSALGLEAGQALTPEQLAGLAITAADFDAAVGRVQPSVRREGFATTPDVTWSDVGSLAEVRA